MDARKDDTDQVFRAAADRLAALEARLDAEQRERYRGLVEKQDLRLRRETERRDKAGEAYEAERRKQKVEATLDMVRRSAASPRELRSAAREYAARQRHVEQCRVMQVRERLAFVSGALAAQQARQAFAESTNRAHRDDARPASTPAAPEPVAAPRTRPPEERREQARRRLAGASEPHPPSGDITRDTKYNIEIAAGALSRSAWLRGKIAAYDEDSVSDLLADIRHLCLAKGIDFDRCDRAAAMQVDNKAGGAKAGGAS